MIAASLCHTCRSVHRVAGRLAQAYFLCLSDAVDDRYPPQPVVSCNAYAPVSRSDASGAPESGATHVALLRAVNVGGANRVPMAALRIALSDRGLGPVSTVLQSGNVLFRTDDPEHVAVTRIRDAVADAFDLDVGVVVRSASELAAVVGRNPFFATGSDLDPATLHVAFLSEHPAADVVASLDPDRSRPDVFAASGREVYLSYPKGSGRSRLTLDYLERQLGVTGTARNWRTVTRLAGLLEA